MGEPSGGGRYSDNAQHGPVLTSGWCVDQDAAEGALSETDIPKNPLLARHRLVDVVDAEQMVVDDALHEIEDAEAHEEGAGQELP